MNNRLLTVDEVKQLLGVNSFSEVSDDQIRIFVAAIPKMDKDVAIKAIEQFPSYSELVRELTTHYFDLSNAATNTNASTVKQVLGAYEQALSLMSSLAQQESIDLESRKWFAEKAVEISDKMESVDRNNKAFLSSVLNSGWHIIGGIATFCLAIFGLSIWSSKND